MKFSPFGWLGIAQKEVFIGPAYDCRTAAHPCGWPLLIYRPEGGQLEAFSRAPAGYDRRTGRV
jgi:hypothetical protein